MSYMTGVSSIQAFPCQVHLCLGCEHTLLNIQTRSNNKRGQFWGKALHSIRVCIGEIINRDNYEITAAAIFSNTQCLHIAECSGSEGKYGVQEAMPYPGMRF